jgi:mono/diheme cytochrome c family protein
MAVGFMLWAARRADSEARPRLLRYLGLWAVAGSLVSYLGYRWWEVALPETTRALFLADPPLLATLADTRQLLLWALTAVLVLAAIFLVALPKRGGIAAMLLITVASFTFFGGYERLREGVRKPFLIHDFMFSNGIRVDEVESLNEAGILTKARWAATEIGGDEASLGRQVFRSQCASCHTLDGYLAIRDYLPEDPDMIYGVLFALADQGQAFTSLGAGEVVDMVELDYPFMPPFVGTEEEMEALVEYLSELALPATQVAAKGVTP